MKRYFKRALAGITAAAVLAVSIVPANAAFATTQPFTEADTGQGLVENVHYLDAQGEEQVAAQAVALDKESESSMIALNESNGAEGWYVLTKSIDTWDTLYISGDVNLILADNTAFSTKNGVRFRGSSGSLTIYSQSTGDAQGKLTAVNTGDSVSPLQCNAGTAITINGGIINATAGSSEDESRAAAIGGGKGKDSGSITINGGTVTATTYYKKGVAGGGAAIGGGGSTGSSDVGHDSGAISINGGTVHATAYGGGAGIGGGGSSGTSAGGNGNVTITGGEVVATSTNGGAGIGGGSGSNSGVGGAATVAISGGTVVAKSDGSSASGAMKGYYGAGIGSGHSSGAPSNSGNKISISGGTVTAHTGLKNSAGGAAIGGGAASSSGTIAISGGTIVVDESTTHSTAPELGIGAGLGAPAKNAEDTVTITGGTIATANGTKAAVDAPTNGSALVYYTLADVNSLYGTQAAVNDASLAGYGFGDVQTDAAGKLHLYLPAGQATANFGSVTYSGTITSDEATNELRQQGMFLHVQQVEQGATTATLQVAAPTGSTVYYMKSDASVTDQNEIINNKTSLSITSNDNAELKLEGLTPGQTTTWYFVAQKAGKTSEIASIEVTPQPISLEQATIQLNADSFVYDGTEQTPTVTVTLNGSTLEEGTDYTVRFLEDTKNVGTVTVQVEGKGSYSGSPAEQTYSITKRPLTVALHGSTTKPYDGTTEVTDTDNLSLKLSNVVSGEDVQAVADRYTYASADAATGITVTAHNVTLAGAPEVLDNYSFDATAPVKAPIGAITRAQAVIEADGYAASREYNGEPVAVPTEDEVRLAGGSYEDLQFEWFNQAGEPLSTAPTNAGQYQLMISLPESTNYTAAKTSVTVTIMKATWHKTVTGTVYPGKSDEVTLPELPEGLAYDTVYFMDGSDTPIEALEVRDGVLTFKGGDQVQAGKMYRCGVGLKGNENYDFNTSSVLVLLTGAEPQPVPVDMSGITLENKTYDGTPLSYTGSARVDGQELSFTYEWLDAAGQVLATAPTDAGQYTLRAIVNSDIYKGYGDKTVTIAPKAVTVTADDKTATVGDAMPDFTYQVTGLVGQDELVTEPTLTCDADMTQAGTYPITIDGAAAGANYTVTHKNGALTVQSTSSGGGGGWIPSHPTHDVTPPADTTGGSVSLSHDQAKKGDDVTITVTPEQGYRVDLVTVTDGKGNNVAVIDQGDGTYTFVMPDSDVHITVDFVKDGDQTPPFVDVSGDAWYADAVAYVYNHGLMTGVSDNEFAPEIAVSRAMIVSMLHRLDGQPPVSDGSEGPFQDVADGAWYKDPVQWAYANHIVNGMSATLFAPDQAITREQLAVMLHNYASYKGLDTTARADLSGYADVNAISPYAREALEWANAVGLINGMSADTLAPQALTTRAQTAAILERFCENEMH